MRVCTCVLATLCVCACVCVCEKECEKEREREGRKKRTESGKESVWGLLHVNCTSSGALVDSIPGTCWSAIHMTVPCCLIIPPQARRRDFRPRETVCVGKRFRGARMNRAPPRRRAASVVNAYNSNRARRSRSLSTDEAACDKPYTQDLAKYKDDIYARLISSNI